MSEQEISWSRIMGEHTDDAKINSFLKGGKKRKSTRRKYRRASRLRKRNATVLRKHVSKD